MNANRNSSRPITLSQVLAIALVAAALAPAGVRADCPDEWFPIFGVPPGTDGRARAATTWDPDGTGPEAPQPVVAGDFGNAGGIFVGRIARFDGVMWLPFGSAATIGVAGPVHALTTWDPDGAGPQPEHLVAGGDFLSAGGITVNRIAVHDGAGWQSLGGGFSGTRVSSLVSWDPDGAGPLNPLLVAGGLFTTTTTGTTVNRVAWWDGAAWQPLGNGFVNGTTSALSVYDPDGNGPLTPRLVAGGNWTQSGTTTVNRVAWWDGAAWLPFASGFNFPVTGLAAWDADGDGPQVEQVIAVGDFTLSGATSVTRVARWDGAAWQALGSGVGSTPNCVRTWDPDAEGPMPSEVVVGGTFTGAGGQFINRIARWNGTTWQAFGAGMSVGEVNALAIWDPDGAGPLVAAPLAAGFFANAGTRAVSNVARWQVDDWRQLGNGVNGSVAALTKWDADGGGPGMKELVAGGLFTVAGGKTVNRIARFDGVEWHPLATALSAGVVNDITTWDPDGSGPLNDQIVAVGNFTWAGTTTVNHIARFDGTQWHAFGSGAGGIANAVTVWDVDGPGGAPGKVIVGGEFNETSGAPGNYVAMWDGSAWQPMGDGFINTVYALECFSPTGLPADTRVYAGGIFGSGATPPFAHIAQWNGAAWESMDEGLNNIVFCMTVRGGLNPTLLVGGAFSGPYNEPPAHRVAVWTGSAWATSPFEPGLSNTTGGPSVNCVTTWDADGAGPLGEQVIAGGSFENTVNGGPPVFNNIARWDGNSWQPLGEGVGVFSTSVNALIAWDPDGAGPQSDVLVVGGSFATGGGLPGANISAVGVCATAPCQPCDTNCDGLIDGLDVQAFIDVLIGGASPCSACGGDANGDASVDFDDVADFIDCQMT